MRHILMLVMLFAISAPTLAPAATYQWRDDAGVLHFTDDSDRIPDKYLKRVREMDSVSAGKQEQKKEAAPPPAAPVAEAPAKAGAVSTAALGRNAEQRARLSSELKRLQEGFLVKKQELERLQHKWAVVKGRTPTGEELQEYEKKKAEGTATSKDNPYINKSPLSSPAPARAAYYKKLEEVRQDEQKARELESQLQALQ